MEADKGYDAKEISTIGCMLGEEDELLGRFFKLKHFALLGARIS